MLSPTMRLIGPLCLILLSAPSSAARGAEVAWDTIVRLTTDSASQITGYSGQHSVAVDAAGNVHVAWLDQRTVPYAVWYRRYDAGARTWLPETMLTSQPGNCFRPGIASDSAGNVHVLWHVENWQGPGIWNKRYDASVHRWKPDTLIDTTTTDRTQQYPSAACVPGSGDAVVAWSGLPDTGASYQVFLKERHQAAGWDSAMQVTTAPVNHGEVSVGAGANGDLAVIWCGMDLGGTHDQVCCRRRVAGVWRDPELVSEVPGGTRQYAPSVAIDRDGRVHVVWHGQSEMGIYLQVFHRMRDASGWSGIESISGQRQYQQQRAAIACDAAGRCHVAWCSKGGTDHMQLVYAQRDTDGLWSSPMILTARESGDVDYPSIACDSDSGIHIVWTDESSGNQDVYYLHGRIAGSGVADKRVAPKVQRTTPTVTIVRSRLVLSQWPFANGHSSIALLDASGRKVMVLYPGWQDIRRLGAGIYFIVDETGRTGPATVIIVK